MANSLLVSTALAALLLSSAQQPAPAPSSATSNTAPASGATDASPPPMPLPRNADARALSDAELAAAIDAEVQRAVSEDRFSGIVMLARRSGGKPAAVLHTRAAGLADREKQIAVTPDTRFRIGSMNKMFTAVAVLQLVQAGTVTLTEPIGTYIRDYPNKAVASRVTVHHLLTHTGGTGNIFTPEYHARRAEVKRLDDYITLFGARDLAFEPGSRWDYSNYGFILLGVIVERVTGTSYYDYVREKIYAPAGMTSTGSEPESAAVPDRSIGYTRPRGATAWQPNTDTLPYRGTSAGGGYSTAGDLVRFADALLSQKLLDAKHTTLLLTGKVDLPPPRMGPGPGPAQAAGPAQGPAPGTLPGRASAAASGPAPAPASGPAPAGPQGTPPPGPPPLMKYAYGFQERTQANGRRSVGHGGGAPGMNGELAIHPDTGAIVVVLANMDPPAATRIGMFIDRRLP